MCVQGTVNVCSWTVNEVFRLSALKLSEIIGTYNIFINFVNRMGHMRAVAPTRRTEKILSMSLFTYMIYLTLNNAFFTYKKMRENSLSDLSEVMFQEFKHKFEEKLVSQSQSREIKLGSEV